VPRSDHPIILHLKILGILGNASEYLNHRMKIKVQGEARKD
jgi:hypothetical protein